MSGDKYCSFSISFDASEVISIFISSVLTWTAYGTLLDVVPVILSAVSLRIKSAVAYVFWIALFEAVLNASVADCLAWSKGNWLYLPLKFLLTFYVYFKQKTKVHNL